MRKAIRKIIPLIALFTVLTIAVSARASWASEVKGGSSVAISEDEPFTATSYLGVDALYSLTSNEYSSAELVERFYKNCYGINVSAGGGGPSISSAGYVFKTPNTPAQGDIVYSPSSGRWAIVKGYSRGTITLFEQDAVSDGKALINRTIAYPSSSYALYTPRPKAGYAYLTLKDAKTGATILTANGRTEETTQTTTTTTTQTTTEPESEKTTGKGTTTAAPKSTYKDKSVAYTTYKGNEATTQAKPAYTTQAMPEGYEQFFTSSASAEEGESAEDQGTTSEDFYITYNYPETRTTQPMPEEEKKEIDPTLIFGIAVVLGIVLIAAAGILAGVVIKKRGSYDDDDD